MKGFRSILNKITGVPSDVDGTRYRRLADLLAPLGKAQDGLSRRCVDYVCRGEPASVLLELKPHAELLADSLALINYWNLKRDRQAALATLFSADTPWDAVEFRRLGDVAECAAAFAFGNYRYQVFGTEKGEDWLAGLLTMAQRALGPNTRNTELGLFTLARVREMLAVHGLDDGPLLDVLFHDFGYGSDGDSLGYFSDAGDYLKDRKIAVAEAGIHLDAPGRAALAAAIGRFQLAGDYLELLLELSSGSAKTVREAARPALQGVERVRLLDALSKMLIEGGASQRFHAAELLGFLCGADATPILRARLEQEKSKKVTEGIRQTLATLSITVTDSADSADGDEQAADVGEIRALDGSIIPRPPPLPEQMLEPLPASLFKPVRRSAKSFNDTLERLRRTQTVKYHWSRTTPKLKDKHVDAMRRVMNGGLDIDLDRWLRGFLLPPAGMSFDRSGLDALFASDTVQVGHLMALMPVLIWYRSEALFSWLNDSNHGVVQTAIKARLPEAVDLRLLGYWWERGGGTNPLRAYLELEWRDHLSIDDVRGLMPYVLEHLELLDEALGMRPRSGDKPLQPGAALDVLEALDQTLGRYLPPLMELAVGGGKTYRERARCLLSAADDIDSAIAELLSSGQQDVRAGAADWLAARQSEDQVPALRKALTKERSEVARAAMLTALEHLGVDISEFIDDSALLADAEKGLKRTRPKDLDWLSLEGLPAVHWRDGTPIDPVIVRWWVVLANKLKQPGGNALFELYLDRMQTDDASRLGLHLLRSWIARDTRTVGEQEANAYAEQHADQQFQYLKQYDENATREQVFARLKSAKRNEYLGSAAANKGLLALAVRADGSDAAAAAVAYLKNHGSRVSQDKALLECLANHGAQAAMQVVLATANRFKAKSVQGFARKLVEQIADRHGWTPEQLADRTVPTAGLDESGRLRLDCGSGRVYTARLNEVDQIEVENPVGKVVKNLPTAKAGEEGTELKVAKKALSSAKKELKQVLAMQSARLQEAMCLQRRWEQDDWSRYLRRHPIAGRLCQRLVWLAVDVEGDIQASFRVLEDDSLTDARDEEVILDRAWAVQLAHSTLLAAEQRDAWRRHLDDYEVTAPFQQLGRPLLEPGDSDRKRREITDRRGYMIESFKLRSATGKLGYQRGQAEDGGVFMTYEKRYEGAGLVAVIEFTGSPLPETNIACALLSLSFRRIRRAGGDWGGAMELGAVSSVLLSETWNDFHQIAEVGTGFDADWEKKAEYW